MSALPAGAQNHDVSSSKGAGPLRGTSIGKLLRLFRASSPRFRATLASTARNYLHYTEFLRGRMQDTDPRVRANLLESLWKIDSRPARDLFRAALADDHHRVRANALLGLCFLGDAAAADDLIELAKSSYPLERMAAAWAMGQKKDERFTSILTMLATGDTEEAVRDRARASLNGVSEE